MKAMTVNMLFEECRKQIKAGNGNKTIMISQDDEGNGYHYLWYTFSKPEDCYLDNSEINEDIAKQKDTIILG